MQCLLTVGFMVHLSGLIGFSHGLSLCKLPVYQMCMGCVDYSNGAMTRLGRLRVFFWGELNQRFWSGEAGPLAVHGGAAFAAIMVLPK